MSNTARAGFTETNALRFIEVFDELITNPANCWLDPDALGLSFSTFRNRISEALLFLTKYKIDGAKYNPDDYQRLRGNIYFRVSKNKMGKLGILVEFKSIKRRLSYTELKEGRTLAPDSVAEANSMDFSARWKEKIYAWLEDENSREIQLIGINQIGTILDDEGIKWLEETFIKADIEFKVNKDLILAVKS